MTKVVVKLIGPNKENLIGPAVTVGSKRWGHNGVDFGKEQEVTPGTHTVTVYSADKVVRTLHAEVPNDDHFAIDIDID
ncbi:hypothetical protein N5I84_05230 [Ralstonia sp. CHL-2022]|uniref:hypothetical protein n=1 Tax=Ralstonia mojiangensis TaxID=2953895 RepID=UPI0021B31A62|nr:hypothetical protein [Ralstonia mojiangensis]MCT7295557.1 hypothetical protein [Ralstonia mojiangensis]